jgi:ferritin-like metal-binding protein YciE
MDELKQVFALKIARMVSVEETIIQHLPMMISKASNEKLKLGLTQHLDETKTQLERLREIQAANETASMKDPDKAFVLLMETAGKDVSAIKDADVRDAVIIASAQTVEHLEIAKYGTLIEWAKELDESDAVSLLKETLGEEEAADKKLSMIAEGGIFTTGVNQMAAHK